MKPPRFEYARPASVEEALGLLAGDVDAKVIAGGQSLIPMLNFRLARPSVLVDVTRLPGFDVVEMRDGWLHIGAGVRQRAAETSDIVREHAPIVIEALRYVGHVPTRTQGTVGGSIAHADPAAELAAVLLCTDGEAVARGPERERAIPAEELFSGPYMTSLGAAEILTTVRIPVRPGQRFSVLEAAPRHGDYAVAGVVATAHRTPDLAVRDVRLVAFGAAAKPMRLRRAEESVAGASLAKTSLAAAARAAAAEIKPLENVGADAAYRRGLLGTLVQRALASLVSTTTATGTGATGT
jgi:CO/xanthine dehydrogenase FAD-binding subunit